MTFWTIIGIINSIGAKFKKALQQEAPPPTLDLKKKESMTEEEEFWVSSSNSESDSIDGAEAFSPWQTRKPTLKKGKYTSGNVSTFTKRKTSNNLEDLQQ